MIKALLLAAALIVTPAVAAKKTSIYVICDSNGNLVSEVTTASPVTVTFPIAGAEGSVYWSVYQLTTPISCENLTADANEDALPPSVNIEAIGSHKPTLKVA